MQKFVGRKRELDRLEELHQRKRPGLVVVKGRRRVGKSRLVAEFASKHPEGRFWNFAGLAPQKGTSAQDQRDYFASQLATMLGVPPFTFLDWTDAFSHLGRHLAASDVVLFDEISWMGLQDPTFIPKLKAWWDKQTVAITLVVCGSVSTWIEENILKSTAFFGRIHLTLTLEPLSIFESANLVRAAGYQGSIYDLYLLLSVLGGIPWYLEQVASGKTASELLRTLCFDQDGLLVMEFDRIFHDLFNGKGVTYKKILYALQDGMKTLAQIRKAIGFAHSGTLSKLLEHLIIAGFVKKQDLWSFKTEKALKQSLYRICDPYMRFFLKFVEPHMNKIEQGGFGNVEPSELPGFEAHMGLQIEQLLLQNRSLLLNSMGIHAANVVADGPFRQTKTTTRRGCQIDYLVQTSTKNLFVCEFKFKKRELGMDLIRQMEEKLQALKVPRGFAAIPVLFHLSGVSTAVATSNYFYRIIDISDYAEQ